jgi:hypothetical protein
MDSAVYDLISRLHAGPFRYVLSVTGGGAAAGGWLLSVPGGSRTVLEVVVPYAEQALREYLGYEPESYCSAQTARAMAERALDRARWLAPGEPTAGVGCTASLRSDRPKRGDHRFHLAVHTGAALTTWSLTLTKETRDRPGEETVVDLVLLNALAEVFGLPQRVAVPLLPGEQVQTETSAPVGPVAAFLAGNFPALLVAPDGRMHLGAPTPRVLLPGSFNPLHEGHGALAEVAARLAGAPAAFELTVVNADKPSLSAEEVRRRLAQFAWRAPVWLTRAPTFAQKADLFPGAVFVVGADTAERIVAPRFYGDNTERMLEALEALRARGCRFLVAGRRGADGNFVELDALTIPPAYRDLFQPIPAADFRLDISSTQLRSAAP